MGIWGPFAVGNVVVLKDLEAEALVALSSPKGPSVSNSTNNSIHSVTYLGDTIQATLIFVELLDPSLGRFVAPTKLILVLEEPAIERYDTSTVIRDGLLFVDDNWRAIDRVWRRFVNLLGHGVGDGLGGHFEREKLLSWSFVGVGERAS